VRRQEKTRKAKLETPFADNTVVQGNGDNTSGCGNAGGSSDDSSNGVRHEKFRAGQGEITGRGKEGVLT
jgi:hypothetical protein